LEAVAVLGLLADDVEHGVDELGALGVVALGPVVAGAGLAEDEVVGAEDLAVGAGAHGVHGAGLEVHEHGARDVPATAGLVVVDVDALELEVGVAGVLARVVDAVLVADHLPELGPDLVPALPALDVQDLPHGGGGGEGCGEARGALGSGGIRRSGGWRRLRARLGTNGGSGWVSWCFIGRRKEKKETEGVACELRACPGEDTGWGI